jgi:hypothetical protein
LSCGCKKKNQVPPPAQVLAKIVLKESIPPMPPQPIQTPQQQVENIVEKLNTIFTPPANQ